MFQDFLSQMTPIDMHVNLRRRDVLVSQHRLNGSQIGSSLQQMSGKAVAESVWTDDFLDISKLGILLDVDEETDATHVATAFGGDKDIIFLAWLYLDTLSSHKPPAKFLDGFPADWNKTLLASFPMHAYETFFEKEVADFQVAKLAHSQAAAIEHLDDGTVALPLWLTHVDHSLYAVYFLQAQHFWQMLSDLWTLEQFCRVGGNLLFQSEEAVKGAHSAQDASCASRRHSQVSQRACKMVQLLQGYLPVIDAFVGIIVEQLLQVFDVCIQRVVCVRTFQSEVLDIASKYTFLHNSGIIYLEFHNFFLSLPRQK